MYWGRLDTPGAFLGLKEEFLGFRRGREPHAQVTLPPDSQVELEIGVSHRARLAAFSAGKVWVFPGAQCLPGLLLSGPGCGEGDGRALCLHGLVSTVPDCLWGSFVHSAWLTWNIVEQYS